MMRFALSYGINRAKLEMVAQITASPGLVFIYQVKIKNIALLADGCPAEILDVPKV